jgi:hypothetical protein
LQNEKPPQRLSKGERNAVGLAAAWLWPKVSSRKDALFAISEAFWVALCVAAFNAVFSLIAFARSVESDVNFEGFFSAALFAGIAFGIRQKSRIAALAGFVFYVLSQGYFLVARGHGNLAIPPLIALALFHGVRGTLAYHKLPPLPDGLPSLEQSFKAVASGHQQVDHKTEQE